MKKIILLLLVVLQNNLQAQTQDLALLAKGDYLGFNAIFNQKDELFGYVALYGYGKSGDKTKKFEYVLLDKNLNPVSNKEFEGDITASDYYAYMNFREQIILSPSRYDYSAVSKKEFFYPFSMIVDPKTNTVTRKTYPQYDGTSFTEMIAPKSQKDEQAENRTEKKEKGYNYYAHEYEIKEGGLIVSEFYDYGKYTKNNSLIRFDDNKKELWRYNYNKNGNKKAVETLKVIGKDESNIYCIVNKKIEKLDVRYIVIIDMKTGEEKKTIVVSNLNKYTLNGITDIYSFGRALNNDKDFDDKLIVVGRNYDDKDSFDGYTRLLINKETLDVEIKTIYFNDLKKYIPKINSKGMVEKGYYLIPKDFFFLKDGSVGLLMEKFKPEGQYTMAKATDLAYVYTNKDFEPQGIKIFDKEKTRGYGSDYLFSQYINGGKDVVFYYRDYEKDEETREKSWNLYINTLINGAFNQEVIPISSKENFIYPYVAKEGYILMQEYNKKDKYNKVRLERLNY